MDFLTGNIDLTYGSKTQPVQFEPISGFIRVIGKPGPDQDRKSARDELWQFAKSSYRAAVLPIYLAVLAAETQRKAIAPAEEPVVVPTQAEVVAFQIQYGQTWQFPDRSTLPLTISDWCVLEPGQDLLEAQEQLWEELVCSLYEQAEPKLVKYSRWTVSA